MKRSYLKRSPFKVKSVHARAESKWRVGKKTKANRKANALLAKTYTGEKYCEARLPGCKGSEWLSWGHPKKRRYLTTEELTTAALLCTPCHAQVERLSHADMETFVMGIIERRAA